MQPLGKGRIVTEANLFSYQFTIFSDLGSSGSQLNHVIIAHDTDTRLEPKLVPICEKCDMVHHFRLKALAVLPANAITLQGDPA